MTEAALQPHRIGRVTAGKAPRHARAPVTICPGQRLNRPQMIAASQPERAGRSGRGHRGRSLPASLTWWEPLGELLHHPQPDPVREGGNREADERSGCIRILLGQLLRRFKSRPATEEEAGCGRQGGSGLVLGPPRLWLGVACHQTVVSGTRAVRKIGATQERPPCRSVVARYSSEVQQPQQPAALHTGSHRPPGNLYDLH